MSRLFALAALVLAAVATLVNDTQARTVAPAPCSHVAVMKRMDGMVRALNRARADRFAAGFSMRGRWYPFTRTLRAPLAGRADIQAFALLRIGAEDEWTIGRLQRVAENGYTMRVRIASGGRVVGAGRTRVRVDCRSGLVAFWTGPALKMPPIVDDD